MLNYIQTFFKDNSKATIVLILSVFLVYYNSLKFGFSSADDQWLIVQNMEFLKEWSNLKKSFLYPVAEIYYRPFFVNSLILDYHVGKLSPAIYHLTNLSLHAVSVILLFRLLLIFKIDRKSSFFFCLLFLTHPILLHSVAWIPGRNDLLLSILMNSSLISLIKYLKTFKLKYLILNTITFICALFTKENAIIFPFLFITYSLVFHKLPLKKLLVPAFIWLIFTCCWFLIRNSVIGNAPKNYEINFPNLKNLSDGFLLFIGKIIFPIQQSVLPTIKNSSLLPGIITSVLITCLCFFPGLKNKKLAYFGIFTFLLCLLIPVWFGASKPGNEHYEQRIYSAMTGIVLFFTQVNFKGNSVFYKLLYCLFLISFILKTKTRLNIYKNELSFIDAGIKEAPDFYLFHLQKADILNKQQHSMESLTFYDKAISLRPNYDAAYNNRGLAYYNLGMFNESIIDFSNAISYSNFNQQFYLNRCLAYLGQNDIENAMKDFLILKKCCHEIITKDIENRVINNWVNILEKVQSQIKLEPNNSNLYFKCANLYYNIEMNPQGNACLKKALQLDPNNSEYKELLKKKS